MSVAYCLPLPSSVTRQRWFVVVLLVVLAALSPRLAEALAATASIMAVVLRLKTRLVHPRSEPSASVHTTGRRTGMNEAERLRITLCSARTDLESERELIRARHHPSLAR
jgi:hypothetical protein